MANVTGPVPSISAPGVKIDGELLYNMRSEVASLLGRKHLNFPGAQPVSFARRHLEELTQQDYYVCEKSDGMRYLLYLTKDEHDEEAQYLIDRKNDYWYIPKNGLHFPVPRSVEGFHINTLIDGELVLDKLPSGQMQPKFLVFDCLILDGNSLMSRTLDKRLAYFKKQIYDPYEDLLEKYPDEIAFMHFIMEMKDMQLGYAIGHLFDNILPKLPHGNDGLIFTCRTSEYKFGTDRNILKWKPEVENSIDFRLTLDFPVRQPDEQDIAEGWTAPWTDYEAVPVCNLHYYAGDTEGDVWYATMYLDDDEWELLKGLRVPLNDRIVECYMDRQKRWRYMRFRDDKINANHITTVESVIESITDRVTKEDLINAQKVIRDEWKKREANDRKESEPRALQDITNKRKADDQGGRPRPRSKEE